MKYTVRALLAVTLLAGFYALAAALVGAFVVLAVLAVRSGTAAFVALKLGVLALVVAAAVVRGLLASRRRRGSAAPVFTLTPQDQPALWAEVRELAAAVGTRAPDEIVLGGEVNAAVEEDARFLGLVGGRRRLFIGVPLLLGLSPLQLRSVLAHELGHYSARHTALAPVTYRGQVAIGRVLSELGPGSWIALPLRWYAVLYLAVAGGVSRRQELEADAFSARLAGSEAAASALREQRPLGEAWEHFVQEYAGLGSEADLRPAPFLAAFPTMLADPEVRAQVDGLRAEPDSGETSRFDSHPPVERRVAELVRTAAPAPAGPAPGPLLPRAAETLAAFEDWLFDGSGRTAAPWDVVVAGSGAELARRQRRSLSRLAGSEATYESFASRISHRGAVGLLDLPPAEERTALADLLHGALADLLVTEAGARFVLDWAGPARLVGADGTPLDPRPALDELATSGTDAALRAWAADHGLDLGRRLAPDPDGAPEPEEARPATELLGAVAPVRAPDWAALLVTHDGLTVVGISMRERFGQVLRGGTAGAAVTRGGEALLRRILATPVDDVRRDATFIAWDDIAVARAVGRTFRASTVVLHLRDGRRRKLTPEPYAAIAGEPWDAVAAYLGERWQPAG